MKKPIDHAKQWLAKAEEDESAGIAILKNTKHAAAGKVKKFIQEKI